MWCLIWTNQTFKWESCFNPLHIVRSKQMTCWSSWYLGSERTYHKCIESIIKNTSEILNIEQLSTVIAFTQLFFIKRGIIGFSWKKTKQKDKMNGKYKPCRHWSCFQALQLQGLTSCEQSRMQPDKSKHVISDKEVLCGTYFSILTVICTYELIKWEYWLV